MRQKERKKSYWYEVNTCMHCPWINETFCSLPIISLLFEIPRSDTKTKCQLIQNALNQLLVKFPKDTLFFKSPKTVNITSHIGKFLRNRLLSVFRLVLAFWMLDECKALVLREINCLLCYAGEGGLSNADGSFPRNTGFLYFTSLYHSKLNSYPRYISSKIKNFHCF